VSALPLYSPGIDVVVEERWHGILWAAVPHRVIQSTPDMMIGWVPAGTLAVHATNRGLPEAEGLTRDQRKMLALKTLTARASEFAETPSKLAIFRPDRWSRINLGFDPLNGHFLGWYVDFELPLEPTPTGLATKDLVLDMWINPDRTWEWKDQEDLELAVAEGIFPPRYRAELDQEAERILTELDERRPPFTEDFSRFQPNPAWATPVLPRTHAWSGDAWSLRSGWRAG
jgi:predicted RNA-binding protein associated with RNAse of E/G family